MGYLLQILLAMGTFGLADGGFVSGREWPLAVLLWCAAPYLTLSLAVRAWRRGRFRSSARWGRVLSALPVAGSFFALSGCGWKHTLERWLDTPVTLLGWPQPALLLALVPFVVYQLIAIDASARLADTRRGARTSLRGLQMRMFLSGFVPVTLYVLAASLVGASEALRIRVEEVALWNAAFSALILASFVAFLPSILRNTWETVRMPEGIERRVLTTVAERASFACREICLWKTGNLMANAAIVGLTRKDRVVLFSDSLLSMLSMRELAAVFGHEMGHAVRRHVTTFLFFALAFFMGADLIATHLVPPVEWMVGGVILVTLVGWYLSFGYLSRRFELEADLHSLELLGDSEALISALEKVGGRLRDVASWRHFSTARRVAFIESAAVDPSVGRRLHTKLRWASRAGLAAFVVVALIELATMFEALQENLVYVDLRLGEYTKAAERVETAKALPDDLVALALHAEDLGSIDVAELEGHALTELERGEAESALHSIHLATLRGSERLADLGRVLRTAGRGELDEARTLAGNLPPELAARVLPLLEGEG